MTDVDLLHRIERLEAQEEIASLMGEYLYLADRDPDADRIAALFAPDAIWEPRGNLAIDQRPTHGREAIRGLFAALPEMLSFCAHFITNAVIDVHEDGTTAHGRWHTFELMTTPDRELVQLAWYENDFVRIDGRWRIQHIRFEDTLSFPFLDGWAQTRFVSLVTGEVMPQASRT